MAEDFQFDADSAQPVGADGKAFAFDAESAKAPSGPVRRLIGDTAVSVGKGIIDAGQTAYGLADAATGGLLDRASTAVTGGAADVANVIGDAITGNDVAKRFKNTPGNRLSQDFNQAGHIAETAYSNEQQGANKRVQDADGFVDTAVAALQNPSVIAHSAVESAPTMMGAMGVIRAGATKAAEVATARALESGATRAAADKAGQAALERFSTGAPGIAAQAGTDFAMSGAQQAQQAKTQVLDLDSKDLAKSPMYQQLLEQGIEPKEARAKLADLAQARAFLVAGSLSAAASPLASGLEGRAATAGLVHGEVSKFLGIPLPKSSLGKLGVSAGQEFAQEAVQSAGEQVGTNFGMRAVDPEYDLSKDVGSQAALGGLTGGLTGAALHPFAHGGAQEKVIGAPAPQLALPAPGGLSVNQIDGEAGINPVIAGHAADNAQANADAVYAARSAHEQQMAELAAKGPLSAAAATAIDSGVSAQAQERRMAAGQEETGGQQASPLALPAPVTEADKQAESNYTEFAGNAPSVSLLQAQSGRAMAAQVDSDYTVVPHPAGGFTLVPTEILTDAQRQHVSGIQSAGQLPSPDHEMPGRQRAPAGRTAERVTYGQNADELGMRNALSDFRRENDTPAPRGAPPTGAVPPSTPPQMPLTAAAAKSRADAMTAKTGVEHEIVPHPLARDKFAVRPTALEGSYARVPDQETPNAGAQEAPAVGANAPVASNPQDGEAARAGSPGAAATEAAPDLSTAAHAAATSPQNDLPHPTTAQAEAGNYRKGHVKLHGLDISIENPAGSVRVATDGSWASGMSNHYGYIRRTEGADGDHVDTFVGDKPESQKVFIVDQVDPKTGAFDEHKVMLGFESAAEAKAAYAAHYPDGWKGGQAVSETTVDGLKSWLKTGNTKAPYAKGPRFDRTAAAPAPEAGTATPAADHQRLLQKPTLEMSDRYDAREATPAEAAIVRGALRTLADQHGVLPDRFAKVARIHIHDNLRGADGTWYWQTKSIGVSAQLVADVASGKRPAHGLVGVISHESWHAADESPDAYYSQDAPSFALASEPNGNRVPTGGIIKEAWNAYLRGAPILQRFLGYPFANINASSREMSNEQFTGMLQSEVFAQLGRLWDTNRTLLRQELPLAYSLFQDIHESAARGDAIGSAVQQALRSRRADGKPIATGNAAAAVARYAAERGGDRNSREGLGPDGGVQRAAEEPGTGGRSGGGRGVQAAPGATEGAGSAPLTGLPATSPGPNQTARDAAATYMEKAGLPFNPPTDYVTVDPARAKRIAEAYDAMKHDPNDPRVKASYRAMIDETLAQWQAIKATGLKVEFIKSGESPYAAPSQLLTDVRDNNHLWVFPTDDGFGGTESAHVDISGNPLLEPTSEKISGRTALANDIFRIVHDYFGHVKEGVGFRANGEENAWRSHAAMYSELARGAMTSETRGQNSWVNFGKFGEQNKTASQEDTQYAPQKTGLMPDEFARDSYAKPETLEVRDEVVKAVPEVAKAVKHLLPEEHEKLRKDTAKKLVDLLQSLPPAKEFAAVAYAGKAKRGWYESSTKALIHVFGPDAPRFAALLAAMSPQTSVESNLRNALRTWNTWTAEGRPTQREKIIDVMGRSVEGNKLTDSVLPAWINNSVRALSSEDPGKTVLSGPKVNSFFRNLTGVVDEVTNDAWMASYALVDQTIFSGGLNAAGTEPGKGPGYMAMSARVREAAKILTKLTHEIWTPAEVQETIWSWAKTVYETANAAGESRTPRELLRDGAITDQLINATPDFRTLFNDEPYASILRKGGFQQRLDTLGEVSRAGDVSAGEEGSQARSEAAPFDRATQDRLLDRSAKRLEQLKQQRLDASKEVAAKDEFDIPFGEGAPSKLDVFESRGDEEIYNRDAYTKIDVWYNRDARSWVVQRKDAAGNQVGDSDYVHSKESAKSIAQSYERDAAFYRWFGNSKVVDGLDRPLRVYHGTDATSITQFDGLESTGWFSESVEQASKYAAERRNQESEEGAAPNVVPVYLSIQNPLVLSFDMNDAGSAAAETFERFTKAKPWDADSAWELINNSALLAAVAKAGYDGIKIRERGEWTWAPMKPEQIKSAVGNSGKFNPSKPDILESRSVADLIPDAQNALADFVKTQRGFNIWDRTIGTQYQKAQKNAQFGKVYNGIQDYLNDSSRLMNDAANQAPDLLPKMEGLADILKRGLSKDDVANVSSAVFDGRLADKVWTDQELAARGLSSKQVDYYRQARAAIDKSLTDTFASEAVKQAKSILPKSVLDQAKKDGDPWVIVKALSDLVTKTPVQQQVYDQLRKAAAHLEDMKRNGYAPLQRFGQYTVNATLNGERSFTMHESERDANKFARALREMGSTDVQQGIMSQDAWQLFQGTSPDTLEIFAEAMGVSENEAMQKYLKVAANNKSVLKRLIQAKKVPGFSTDVTRTLAQFITSNARAAGRNYHWGDVLKAANDIPKEQGDVKDEAVKLAKYLEHPKEEAGAIRGLLFVQFLGGSIASALTNATQPVLMTYPYLARFGAAKAAAAMASAAKVAATGKTADVEMREALRRATEEGIVSPHEVAGLYAESIRNFGSNMTVRRILKVWGSLFSIAEQFNRRITFVAAYDLAKANGEPDPYAFATNAIAETQGVYNKGNRPNWARGAVGATLFTFKQYSVSYLEFLSRLPPKQKAIALALLVVAAGAQGLPGADDLEDVIDTIAESLGYAFNSKKELREFAARTLGEELGGFVTHGVSALPGVPLDVQARLGIGNLIPGTGLFKRSTEDKSSEVLEVFGAAGSQAKSFMDAISAAQAGNTKAVAISALPLAVQNALKALDMEQAGYYRDMKGRRVVDVDEYDAMIKGIGFQPSVVAKASRVAQDINQDVGLVKNVGGHIADAWAQGIVEKDPAKIERARAQLLDWNARNPEARVQITPQQIGERVKNALMLREQRLVKSTPVAIRGQVVQELRP